MSSKEHIEFKEQYTVADNENSFVTGFVVGRTEDGKILFEKKNMIVKTGRNLLLRKAINNETTHNIFQRIFPIFGESDSLSRPDMTVMNAAELSGNFGNVSTAKAVIDSISAPATGLTVNMHIIKDSKNSQLGLRSMGMIYMSDIPVSDIASGTSIASVISSKGGYIFRKNLDANNNAYYTIPTETTIQPDAQYAVGTLFSRVTFPPYPDSSELDILYAFYF